MRRKKFFTLLLAATLPLFLSPKKAHALAIYGHVFSLDGAGVAGVSVNLSGASSGLFVTDNTGAYSFSSLISGSSYTVTAAKPGTAFSPPSKTFASLTTDQTQDFIHGKRWVGGGGNALASNAANWSSGEAPAVNDVIRFDAGSAANGCVWDAASAVDVMEFVTGFSSSVTVAADMDVGSITIAAGEVDFNSHEIRISRDFTHTGGLFKWALNGTALWNGSVTQTVSMTKTSLGGNLYASYFVNFRVAGTSTVVAGSDLVIDGTFNISSGRFDAGNSTHTLTGGSQIGASSALTFNWDDSVGTFNPGAGTIAFDSTAAPYHVQQAAANSFFNLAVYGRAAVKAVSNLTINGNVSVGEAGSTAQLNLSDGLQHTVAGVTTIGPSSTASPALALGTSHVTFNGNVSVATATFVVAGGQVTLAAAQFSVGAQGTLSIQPASASTFIFADGSHFKLTGGTLLNQGSAQFTSSSPGTARYAMDINGIVNCQSTLILDSMDAAGFHLGALATPLRMKAFDVRHGAAGGAAINFDPVSVATVAVEQPVFDATMSTNVRAIVDPLVVASPSVFVTEGSGARTGPAYENDPSGVVFWGTIGTPVNFSGSPVSPTSLLWSWTPVNKPLGFVVKAATGGAVSPSLPFGTTSWAEVNLSTNANVSRFVEAFTDVATADSSSFSKFTAAAPALNPRFTDIGFSSVTLAWDANGNPAETSYLLDRSTTNVTFVRIASGTISQLAPYLDANLSARTPYYYRVTATNDEGAPAAAASVSTTTRPVPPPVVAAITPASADNLGTKNFSITGFNFQEGATVVLSDTKQVLHAKTSRVVNQNTMTAAFSLTGAFATNWDVEIENADGGLSLASGDGLLSVTNASSAGDVTIQAYTAAQGTRFATRGNTTVVDMAAGALSDARIYLSVDPENTPLTVDPSIITEANSALAGLTFVPGSVREVNAYTSSGRFTSTFNAPVTLSISFADADGDGIVDGMSLRTATLRVLTLDEDHHAWTNVGGAGAVDFGNKLVSAPARHFSVYALFGSATPGDLNGVVIYPSPWKPGSGGRFDASAVTISHLTETGSMRIYTLDARLVKEIPYDTPDIGTVTWDGKNSDGASVGSGVYLFKIKAATGQTRTVKMGIER